MESSELNLNEQESWLRIHTIPYKVNSVGQTAAGRLHFKQDGDNEWKNLGFILRTINRPIFRGLWGLKRTQNKTVCEVIPYLNLTEKENISESFLFFFFFPWLSWNSLPHSVISTSKILVVSQSRTIYSWHWTKPVIFAQEAPDSLEKIQFWAGCLRFSTPVWNSSQLLLWGFKSESKPVISRAELFAVNWITVAQKGYNWRLQEVIDWT